MTNNGGTNCTDRPDGTRGHGLHRAAAVAAGHVLLLVAGLPTLAAAVLPVGRWDGVNGGALFAGGMGGMGRVGQTRPRLSRVVVELHQAEDQVCGHELKLIRRVRDHIPAARAGREKER